MAIEKKYSLTDEALGMGVAYFDWQSSGLDNVDIKGVWIKEDGTQETFLPPTKYARSHQIKWFGFT